VTAPVRNGLIIALLALGVAALPGGGTAANFVGALLFVLLTLGLGLFAGRIYMERRTSLHALGDQYRAMLYGACGVAVFALASGPKLFQTGAGTIVWFALMGAASYALYAVYRHAREY
jgi:hypothetical protein